MAEPDPQPRNSESLQLLAEEVVLDLPAVDRLLQDAARAAATGVGLSCGITYVARYGVVTVASSDARANAVDEVQYGAGEGPCLEALRTRDTVRVHDLTTETRWNGYRELALAAGVRSSLSFPLVVDDVAMGALNVYSTEVGPLPPDQEAAAMLASNQVAGILHTVRLLAAGLIRDEAAAEEFRAHHELDVATGIVMMQRGCGDSEARAALIDQARADGIPLRELVTRILSSSTSRPEDPT